MLENLKKADQLMQIMARRAEAGELYDQVIVQGNKGSSAVVQALIDGLVTQTRSIARFLAALKHKAIEIERSASLNDPEALWQ